MKNLNDRGRIVLELPSDLVTELLARYDGDLFAHSLVGVKVQAEAGVVLFDERLGRLLHRLGSYASLLPQTHTHKIRINQT